MTTTESFATQIANIEPSEVFDDAIAMAGESSPTINALSFQHFVAHLARNELEPIECPSDADDFHSCIDAMLGEVFIQAACTLKATGAFGWRLDDGEEGLAQMLANDGIWIDRLDDTDQMHYRELSAVYGVALRRTAKEFEKRGWSINTDRVE